jgi:hypothetical protein
MKVEIGYLLEEFHNILSRWKCYFCQILLVNAVNDIKQTGIQQSNHQYLSIMC